MSLPVRTRVLAPMLALGLLVPLVGGSGVDAGSTRTKGTGRSINLGWTEYDPDDLLGLPGNVHVGYLWMENGQWGDWGWGGVVDFDCEPGEVPWGHGGGHEAVAEIAVETASVVESATEGAIDDVVDAGGSVVDAAVVVDTIGAELT
ncbi:MAG: hypothetical protein HKN41_05360, partial [Ilumatobacter sp.]|nr:hypothetical protein [Ilumatobacter sp.]